MSQHLSLLVAIIDIFKLSLLQTIKHQYLKRTVKVFPPLLFGRVTIFPTFILLYGLHTFKFTPHLKKLTFHHRTRKENLARAIEHEANGNSAAAYECYQKAVDITPLIAHELIQVIAFS